MLSWMQLQHYGDEHTKVFKKQWQEQKSVQGQMFSPNLFDLWLLDPGFEPRKGSTFHGKREVSQELLKDLNDVL